MNKGLLRRIEYVVKDSISMDIKANHLTNSFKIIDAIVNAVIEIPFIVTNTWQEEEEVEQVLEQIKLKMIASTLH